MRPDQPNDNTELRLPFGLREGRMWAPREVASGLACDCTCPACGSPLESRNKGSKHKAYFAHHSGNTCHGAYESAIYRMAQQLICDRLRLTLPAWNGAEGMPNPPTATDSRGSRLLGKRVYYPSRSVQLRTAKTEPNIADYRPDVLAEDNEGELLIEIRVSDVVDDRKGRSLPPDGRRMMEIDLSGLSARQAEDPKTLEAMVLDRQRNRSWISCPPATERWRASRDELLARTTAKNRQIVEVEERRQEEDRRKAQRELEREAQRERKKAARREPHLEDLRYLVQVSQPDAIADKYALLQRRDEGEADKLLAMIPALLRNALRCSSGPAWAYEAHYLLWQPAMYLQFIDGKPAGHPLSRFDLGRWLRVTYGVDPVLWRLFMVQWVGRKEARRMGFQKHSLHVPYFTDDENRTIPNFFDCVDGFVGRLIEAGVLELDHEPGGDLMVTALPADGVLSSRKPFQSSRFKDPLLETGVDSYIGRRISHTRLGVGIIRERVLKGSPTYLVCFDGARGFDLWLGDPHSSEWKLLDDRDAPDQWPSSE